MEVPGMNPFLKLILLLPASICLGMEQNHIQPMEIDSACCVDTQPHAQSEEQQFSFWPGLPNDVKKLIFYQAVNASTTLRELLRAKALVEKPNIAWLQEKQVKDKKQQIKQELIKEFKELLESIKLSPHKDIENNINAFKNLTALHCAVITNRLQLARKLIESSADVNLICKSSSMFPITPLNYACADGNLEMVKLLLQEGANINAKSAEWLQTPLMDACKGISYWTPFSTVKWEWFSPSEQQRLDIIELLLDNGASVQGESKETSRSGSDALSNFIINRKLPSNQMIEMVKRFISLGSNINSWVKVGGFPEEEPEHLTSLLAWTIRSSPHEIPTLLMNSGADVNRTDHQNWSDYYDYTGTSPLMHALDTRYDQVGRLVFNEAILRNLITKGANLEAKNKYNLTALDIARSCYNDIAVKIISEALEKQKHTRKIVDSDIDKLGFKK